MSDFVRFPDDLDIASRLIVELSTAGQIADAEALTRYRQTSFPDAARAMSTDDSSRSEARPSTNVQPSIKTFAFDPDEALNKAIQQALRIS